jgi:hypothetical protein
MPVTRFVIIDVKSTCTTVAKVYAKETVKSTTQHSWAARQLSQAVRVVGCRSE